MDSRSPAAVSDHSLADRASQSGNEGGNSEIALYWKPASRIGDRPIAIPVRSASPWFLAAQGDVWEDSKLAKNTPDELPNQILANAPAHFSARDWSHPRPSVA